MLMKRIALAMTFGALCFAGSAMAEKSPKEATDAAIAAAIAAQKAAAAAGGEWRDTGKIIKKAKEAAAEGNYGTAQKLAKKAEAQGKIGKAQAMSQAGVGNPKYLYN